MNPIHIRKLPLAGLLSIALASAGLALPTGAFARDGGGATKTNVSKGANSNRNANVGNNSNRNVNNNSNKNVNVNNNSNKNVNVNSNRNTNVNVNSNRHVDIDIDHDDHHHPIGTAVAIGATVAVTAAIVGSVTTTLPPACTIVIVNGLSYQQCGSTWYQPQYVGSSVQYVVVAPIR
jgi:hypothetical protein